MIECFVEQDYMKQEIKSGCAVSGGRFHQRCVCNQPVHFCQQQCDTNMLCKGYVGPVFNEVTKKSGCQFALIKAECPQDKNCSLLNEGVGVDEMLTRGEKTGEKADGYLGCYIKKTRNLF